MAINFPISPTVGSDYSYQGIKYTYQADGYWAVTTVGTQGVASPEDLNAGTDSVKYLTPTSFSGSKYDITISNFGSASQKDVGTAPDEVPLNSDLGTAAVRDVGTAAGDIPLAENIVESVVNSYGRCVKFIDGTMIFTSKRIVSTAVDDTFTVQGITLYRQERVVIFPVEFTSEPVLSATATQNTASTMLSIDTRKGLTSAGATIGINSLHSYAAYAITRVDITAIGRWK